MIIILIRTIVLYLFILLSLRIMGKTELSEMQPFQLVVLLLISELAAFSIGQTSLPLLNSIIAITALMFIQIILSLISMKSEKARGIICGKPSILINKGVIEEKELRRLRMNINDLLEHLRTKNFPDIADVEFAILETNGDLSVIPKPEKQPATVGDIQKNPPAGGIPISLILDGRINEDNLKKANRTKDWLLSQLKVQGIQHPKEVFFGYIDANQTLRLHKKNNGGKISK